MWATQLCVTKGAMGPNGEVNTPTFRAVVPESAGDAITLDFLFHGRSQDTRGLASGSVRQQIGLKLRAADGCNLLYLMWRMDLSYLEGSVKLNPGARRHSECGPRGYTKIVPSLVHRLSLRPGSRHQLRGQVRGDALQGFVDGKLVWQGTLPYVSQTLVGLAGIRSDNLAYEIVSVWVTPATMPIGTPHCAADGED